MRYVDEFRAAGPIRHYAGLIRARVTRPWTLMEICGGQTHAIVKYGIDSLLPPELTLVHGPGCPVCVTPVESIDRALALAARPGLIFCSFGDMLRVPGSAKNLLMVKAEGGDVRVVHSPLEALTLAEAHPDRQVVFFAVGFETTAPASAMAVFLARRRGVSNFSLLLSQVRVPPALEAILGDADNRIAAVLAAGHVCAVMGTGEYGPLAASYRTPMVVTGFEPLDIIEGVYRSLVQLEEGRHEVDIQYRRAVRPEGNPAARRMLDAVFEPIDKAWRGLGVLPGSGLGLNADYAEFDAERRFPAVLPPPADAGVCISGQILCGVRKPHDCPAFGTACTPEHPLGATMVSSEGACAAYHRYRRIPVAVV